MQNKLLAAEKVKFDELYEEILSDDGMPNIMAKIDTIMAQVQEAQHGEKSETSSMISDDDIPSSKNSNKRSKTYTNVNQSLQGASILKRREGEALRTDRSGNTDDE